MAKPMAKKQKENQVRIMQDKDDSEYEGLELVSPTGQVLAAAPVLDRAEANHYLQVWAQGGHTYNSKQAQAAIDEWLADVDEEELEEKPAVNTALEQLRARIQGELDQVTWQICDSRRCLARALETIARSGEDIGNTAQAVAEDRACSFFELAGMPHRINEANEAKVELERLVRVQKVLQHLLK